MANYKIEALWDCMYCGNKGVRGSLQNCPNCGHTRGKEVRFYLPQDISIANAVDEGRTSIPQGADWLCIYCGSYNNSHHSACKNCGAVRDKNNKDYFGVESGKRE